MHLTRMALNPARRGARALLSSPQVMHAAVLAAFPPGDGGVPAGRVLWRVDTAEAHRTLLYVTSPAAPDLTHVIEQAGWPTSATWETRDYRPLLERLAVGQRWVFRLTANPVHSVRLHADRDTQPVAHVTADQQLEWLTSRTARWGVDVLRADGAPDVVVTGRRTLRFPRGGRTVTLAQATYDGVLCVADPDALRRVLVGGVGRGKAYGCGLMTLAPAP